jgi:small conductance mechanosensitive channel
MDMENIIPTLTTFATTYGLKIIGAILVLIVGRIIANIVRNVIGRITKKSGTDPAVASFLQSLGFFLIMTFTFLAALGSFGIETASMVAVLGAAGFAVGFAMQGSLANFAAGVMLLVFRPYNIGDFVEAGGAAGTVKQMNLFTTVMNTPDNIRVMVPNGKIFGDTIKNVSAEDLRRVDMVVGIGYGSDIAKAKQIMADLLTADSRVLADPALQIAVAELADCSVNLVVRPWVKKEDYWGLKFDFTQQVKEAFDKNGIEIPFPQTVVHQATMAAEG